MIDQDRPVGWAERRVQEAIKHSFSLNNKMIDGVVVSPRLLPFVPSSIDITIQLPGVIEVVDVEINFKF